MHPARVNIGPKRCHGVPRRRRRSFAARCGTNAGPVVCIEMKDRSRRARSMSAPGRTRLIVDGRRSTLSRRWRLKKQTFARHLELRSGRPETANRVFGSYVRHHDRDWRTQASFAVRRTPSRVQILGIPLVARALDRLLEHIAQPMPRRIFTIRGVLIPY
jgi:hypothetical protein